jgi:hypothetical protein
MIGDERRMTIAFDRRVAIPPDVLVQELDGESVILDVARERYFGLDRIGTHMWVALTTLDSIEAAYESLLAAYDVDSDLLRQDLLALVTELVDHGLVDLHGE